MIAALREEVKDLEYLQGIEDWDGVAGDGIDAIG